MSAFVKIVLGLFGDISLVLQDHDGDGEHNAIYEDDVIFINKNLISVVFSWLILSTINL